MRHLITALVAAIAVFMWGFIAWAAVGLYDFATPTTPNDAKIVAALDEHLNTEGAYFLPSMPTGYGAEPKDEAQKAVFDDFETRLRKGPVALVFFHPSGMEPMEPSELVKGFIIEFASALLLSCVLSAVVGGVKRKLMVGFTIALFAATAAHGVMGNFMHIPTLFTLAMWMDVVIAWTIASAVIANMLVCCDKKCAAKKSAAAAA